ncbi:hypothetical protein [Nocardioides daphniae]|uniref:ARB-07466-like C-terminal domain-containing protein n=1 Tax=Nocardioides daphniae TaxID=402297 RepID=A0A4P7UBL7_9ACTN|nr:hypothetical protein [Nocardioides daphniae]QCC76668.1 hypothetical protein E2C04_04565 [Nocardioides daphniae]GGD15182.1 hypothetical protein GCM10007231_12720 [Nocardioides daphniae]
MSRRRRAVGTLVTLALVAAVVAGVWLLVDRGVRPLLAREECVAEVDGATVTLSLEQAENAALIAAIGEARGLPARAVTIALATAYQESKIVNISYGDRDSLGLFQQRPSQGWGSEEEIMDPVFATHAFYDALVKLDGYRDMEVTVAAQKVQRSAYPDAYADHEADARVLASALRGHSRAAFHCTTEGNPDRSSTALLPNGLTERADVVREEVVSVFGQQSLGGFEPRGVSSGHMRGSAHYDGRAVDIFYRPINAENKRRGWAMAHYLVAMADRLGIATVIFDDRIWHSGRRSGDGWRDYRVPRSSKGDRKILEHRDHVHVDVHE